MIPVSPQKRAGQAVGTAPAKIVGFVMTLNGNKTVCSLCHRNHGNSFIVQRGDERLRLGSGCVQKVGIGRRELARAFSKVTVVSSRLAYDLMKEGE